MKTGKISGALALGTALSLCIEAPAVAQTTSGGELELNEIIVTARRVEERLQDVPISITVFNQTQLSNRNVTTAADLAAFTPSLSVNNNYGSENSSFAIRGFVQDSGTPPSVGVYFADVVALRGPTQGTQAGDTATPGSFFDLQNIQVLKGPQGTLFGRNTTGGAVLFVPQKPTSNLEGYVEASGGNYGMNRVEAAVNLPLNDKVRFRLALDHQKRDGYERNISGIGPSDYDNVDYTAVRLSAVVDVTANIENYTIGSYGHSDTNGDVQKLIACNPAGFNAAAIGPAQIGNFIGVFSCGQLAAERARGAGFWDVEAALPTPESLVQQWQFINTTTWTASDNVKVKNIASYGQFKDFQRSPLFGTNWSTSEVPAPWQQTFARGIGGLFTGVFPIPGANTADQATYTEELQLQGASSDSKLTYQAGVYFEWSDPLALVGNQSPQTVTCTNVGTFACIDAIGSAFSTVYGNAFGAPGFIPVQVGAVNYTGGETTYRDRGIYTQSTYSLTDQLKLTAGLRETSDYQSNTATRITNRFSVLPPYPPGVVTYGSPFPVVIPGATCTDPNLVYPACTATNEKKSNKPTWLLGLDFKPMEDMLLYAKYARGYRAGGIITNAPTDHRTFDPEKVDSFEIGMKSSFAEPVHGLFNISTFYNNFSNQQIQIGYNANNNAPVSPTTAILNAGKSRIYGAEIEASITPVTGLSFDLNYTYLNATIQSISSLSTTDTQYVSASAIFPGDSLALSPKNKAALETIYTLPLPVSIGRIAFGATFVHTDKMLTNYQYNIPAAVAPYGENLSDIPATNLLNLNLNWKAIMGSSVDVSLFVTNVADKEYYTYIPGLGGGGLQGQGASAVFNPGSGSEFAVLGAPRMFGGRIRYSFGK